MAVFAFSFLSSGSMEVDAAPSPLPREGGAGGGKLDEVLSATLLLVEVDAIVVSFERTPATENPGETAASLRAGVLTKGTAGR